MVISVPGLASHRKLLQMPFFSGSSRPSSGSQYVARRTHSVVVLPSKLSPYLEGNCCNSWMTQTALKTWGLSARGRLLEKTRTVRKHTLTIRA